MLLLDSEGTHECIICRESLSGHLLMSLPCQHHFHALCIVEWFQHNPVCPICRREIPEAVLLSQPEPLPPVPVQHHKTFLLLTLVFWGLILTTMLRSR